MFAKVVATIIVTLAVGAPAWASDKDDQQIYRELSRRVLSYPQFTIFDSVHAWVQDGVVTLTGKVTMPYKREEIAKRAARVNGVTQVRNDIAVLPVSMFDDELRFQIARAIYGHSSFWSYGAMTNPPIHIIVEHGRVTLEGVVNNNVERMLARSIATSSSAFSVTNNLRTDAEVTAELERL